MLQQITETTKRQQIVLDNNTGSMCLCYLIYNNNQGSRLQNNCSFGTTFIFIQFDHHSSCSLLSMQTLLLSHHLSLTPSPPEGFITSAHTFVILDHWMKWLMVPICFTDDALGFTDYDWYLSPKRHKTEHVLKVFRPWNYKLTQFGIHTSSNPTIKLTYGVSAFTVSVIVSY